LTEKKKCDELITVPIEERQDVQLSAISAPEWTGKMS
jgi:hypothetical protein